MEGFVRVTYSTDDGAVEDVKALDFRVSCPDSPAAGDTATVEIAWQGRLDATHVPPIEFDPTEMRRAFKRLNLPVRSAAPTAEEADPAPLPPAAD